MPETRAAPRKPVKGPQRRAIGGSALIVVCDPVKHTYGTKSAGKFGRPKTTRTTRARARGRAGGRAGGRLRTHVPEASVIGAAVCFPDVRDQVKSSQVKSSSNFNGGRARRLWGARRHERSGGRGVAQLACGWKALSRGFIHNHIVFFLRERDISRSRGPGGYSIALFAMRHTSTPLTQKPHHTLTPHHTLKNHTTLLDSWIHSFSTHSQTSQTTLSDLLGLVCTLVLFTAGISLSLFSVGAQASLADLGSRLPEGSAISHSKIKGTHAACGTVPLN